MNKSRIYHQCCILSGLALLVCLILVGCGESVEVGKPDIVLYAVNYSDCSETASDTDVTYCVHEVISATPHNGNCSTYSVGDKLCINCPEGVCPSTTEYYAPDDFWLRACIVRTRVVNSSCKDIWPDGTCKYYVTLVKMVASSL